MSPCGQGRHEHLLDEVANNSPLIGPSITQGASMRLCRKAAMKVSVFQMAMHHARIKMLPAQAPDAQQHHIGLDPGLINADQAPGVKLVLIGLPACALERDVAAGLLGRQYRFF